MDEQTLMVRAFLQGLLVTTCAVHMREFLNIDHVEQPTDEQGNYEPHFVVQTHSGVRIKVSVDAER